MGLMILFWAESVPVFGAAFRTGDVSGIKDSFFTLSAVLSEADSVSVISERLLFSGMLPCCEAGVFAEELPSSPGESITISSVEGGLAGDGLEGNGLVEGGFVEGDFVEGNFVEGGLAEGNGSVSTSKADDSDSSEELLLSPGDGDGSISFGGYDSFGGLIPLSGGITG